MYSKYEPTKESTGYLVKKYKVIKIATTIIYNNIYKCKSGSTISSLSICNGVLDCGESDTSDEEGCTCTNHDQVEEMKCKYISFKFKTFPSFLEHSI